MFVSCRSPFFTYTKRVFSHYLDRRPFTSKSYLSQVPPIDLSLCLVTDRKDIKDDEEFYSRIQRAIEAEVITCIQYREQTKDLQKFTRTAHRLKEMLCGKNIPLIINNHVDVALAVNAEGVHLGQTDFPYKDAKRLLGKKVIGLTVDTIEDVLEAEALDVSYLGVQVFPSKNTKPVHKKLWWPEGLKKIRELSRHRLVAIGGIHLDNLETIYSQLQLGKEKDGIAMVGDLWRGNTREVAQKIRAKQHLLYFKQQNK